MEWQGFEPGIILQSLGFTVQDTNFIPESAHFSLTGNPILSKAESSIKQGSPPRSAHRLLITPPHPQNRAQHPKPAPAIPTFTASPHQAFKKQVRKSHLPKGNRAQEKHFKLLLSHVVYYFT